MIQEYNKEQAMKSPDHVIKNGAALLLLLGLWCFTSGCCTRGVWDLTSEQHWNPQPGKPTAWVTRNGQDVLIAFRQHEVMRHKPRERLVAGWLSKWPEVEPLGEKQLAQLTQSMTPLPVIHARQLAERKTPERTDYLVWCWQEQHLTVHLNPRVIGPESLPRSEAKQKTFARCCLAPIGFAGDAAIVTATALAVAAGYAPTTDDLNAFLESGDGQHGSNRLAQDY